MHMKNLLAHFTQRRPASRGLVLAFLAAALLLTGCAETGQMRSQPRYDPLEASLLFEDGRSARVPVPGTVPYSGDTSPNAPNQTGVDEAGNLLEGFPVEVDAELVQLGQERYEIFCTPCHGATGEGNGKATQFGFPKPPSLLATAARELTTGQVFQIITEGRGTMFPYGYRVGPDERWAVIAYMRAMQLKNGQVTPQELTPAELDQIGGQP